MPTIREVAEHAQVSVTTVSHVINNTRFVSEAVRERVQHAMRELGYRPNSLARSLRRGETRTLGLVLPDSANPYFAEMARAVENAAFAQGYSVIISNTDDDPAKEMHYVAVLTAKQVDGIIFIATGETGNSLTQLSRSGPPVVLVDRNLHEVQLDSVLADNQHGGYLAGKYLIESGCRRLACIAGPSSVTPSAQRVTGFRQALEEAGLDCRQEWILRGDFHPSSGYDAALQLLTGRDLPDGIFACNDLMAIGALRAIVERGYKIPQDVSLVGYDDIELASFASPPLTTIVQPKAEMAAGALRLLLERINNSDHPTQSLVLPTRLVQRQSTRSRV